MRRQLADRLDVERLRSSSQPGQGHVLDHPRTQWRHGGLLSLMRRRARARPTASTKYTPSATTPAFTTRALGEAVPSNPTISSVAKPRAVTRPPDGVNFTALSTRFDTASNNRLGSPRMIAGRLSDARHSSFTPFAS